jgi:hypothetical protein
MNRNNSIPSDFRPGAQVRIVDSSTAPGLTGEVGTVLEPDDKYRFRVGVRLYVNRDFRDVYFHASELERIED